MWEEREECGGRRSGLPGVLSSSSARWTFAFTTPLPAEEETEAEWSRATAGGWQGAEVWKMREEWRCPDNCHEDREGGGWEVGGRPLDWWADGG